MDIYHIIVKKLNGEITVAEEKYFTRWIKSDPSNGVFYKQLKKYWEFKDIGIEEKKKKTWSRLRQQINASKKPAEVRREVKIIPFKRVYWMVASVLLVVCIVLVPTWFKHPPPVTHSLELVRKVTTPGQNLVLRLPDGTQVKLNAESEIKYPKTFPGSAREVHLVGEAFFQVEKDSLRPFIIHTADILTTVKGTSFNISAYPENNIIGVAVETGKVEVQNMSDKGRSMLLTRHEAAAFDKDRRSLHRQEFFPDMISWKDGVIVFDQADYEEIVKILERWYGVKIETRRKVDMGEGFVGRFENQSLKVVVESISYAGGFSFEINNDVLTIY